MTDAQFWNLPEWKAYYGAAVKLGRVEGIIETVRADDTGTLWVALDVDGTIKRAVLTRREWPPGER
jgi:hypothetical protein